MSSIILSPNLYFKKTKRFSVVDHHPIRGVHAISNEKYQILLNWNCKYTNEILEKVIQWRPGWCQNVDNGVIKKDEAEIDAKNSASNGSVYTLQLADFENIEWESVLANNQQLASSYLIRKGLSRKAQLSLQIKRYLAKHNNSILAHSVPVTYIIETWNAFEEDVKLDLGGGFSASFDLPYMKRSSLKEKLAWILDEFKEIVNGDNWWILKPSVANKGVDISIILTFDELVDKLAETPDMREWVLQYYIDNPLLILNRQHKFHLRVYVLCVGSLQVYVYQNILVLLAARKYDVSDMDDMLKHLTNTARACEDDAFVEEHFVKLINDLPSILHREYSNKYPTIDKANAAVKQILQQVNLITGELFSAFENEYSIFTPMPNCFEVYGIDFLVDEDLGVYLLEVNPGPDFKQTGGKLKNVINQLWDQIFRIVVDCNQLTQTKQECVDELIKQVAPDFEQVYSKMWSVANLQGGMKLS